MVILQHGLQTSQEVLRLLAFDYRFVNEAPFTLTLQEALNLVQQLFAVREVPTDQCVFRVLRLELTEITGQLLVFAAQVSESFLVLTGHFG